MEEKSGIEAIKDMEKQNKSAGVDEYRNPPKDVITIIKEKDGNYRGYVNKNGKIIEDRQFDPIIVLQALLTHD